jgi:hypothetical protein
MKTNYEFSDKGMVCFVVAIAIIGVALLVALAIWAEASFNRSVEITNTYARCKSAGGKMGYSKCFKDGKEI